MDFPSGHPAHSGEFPSWDAALALVNHDLDALLPGRGPLRLWEVWPVCDEHWLGMHAREGEEARRAVWWWSCAVRRRGVAGSSAGSPGPA
ncbi:hypothetical protein ACSCBZ_09155 [Streptomyces niveiscabiei]|uniref:hypothetical protein n=1 Tax=Streptomyces TaxID=1883 RepID=UPI0010579F14|nr:MULTISPECIES: hypothetical protein [Streptomyces]